MSYSQFDEEQIITSRLSWIVGRALDVGSHDGVWCSNTRRLWELGWHVTFVEPEPHVFASLMANYKGSDRAQLVHSAVGAYGGLIDFHTAGGGGVDTTNEMSKTTWEGAGFKFTKILEPMITPSELLNAVGHDFDFVSIDTEGTNFEVLSLFPWLDMCTRLVCVEHDDRDREINAHMGQYGFKQIHRTACNLILER